jgi:hypothetical protein
MKSDPVRQGRPRGIQRNLRRTLSELLTAPDPGRREAFRPHGEPPGSNRQRSGDVGARRARGRSFPVVCAAPHCVVVQRKCTEPVTPSSGFPTDRRRSDCLLESHQPRTLRTRCSHDSRGDVRLRQARRQASCRNLRFFLFARVVLRREALALESSSGKETAEHECSAARFAEPGTLSSTVPTDLPLPRTAAREASSYRRPVLGAGGTLRQRSHVLQDPARRNSTQFGHADLGTAPTEIAVSSSRDSCSSSRGRTSRFSARSRSTASNHAQIAADAVPSDRGRSAAGQNNSSRGRHPARATTSNCLPTPMRSDCVPLGGRASGIFRGSKSASGGFRPCESNLGSRACVSGHGRS